MQYLVISLFCQILFLNNHKQHVVFAHDTLKFSVANEVVNTASKTNCDQEKIRLWAWQWKMQFNPDKIKEVIFSFKRIKPHYLFLKFEGHVISQILVFY